MIYKLKANIASVIYSAEAINLNLCKKCEAMLGEMMQHLIVAEAYFKNNEGNTFHVLGVFFTSNVNVAYYLFMQLVIT